MPVPVPVPDLARAYLLLCCWPLLACHAARTPSLTPLPRAATAHYVAGEAALYRGELDDAIAELTAARAAAPDQPNIAIELARALGKAKRSAEARAVLADERMRWPEHPQVWLATGELLEADDPPAALAAYHHAIALADDDEAGYLGAARIEFARSASRDAEHTLRALVAAIPTSHEGHYRLGHVLAARGALADALAQFAATLELDPDHIDARVELSRAQRRTGHLDLAITSLRGAFDRSAEPLDLAEELFDLLCEADDLRAAADLLTSLDDERSDLDALMVIARLAIGIGRYDHARAIAHHVESVSYTHLTLPTNREV